MIDLKVNIFLIFRKSDYQRSKEEDNGERNNNKVSTNFILKHIFILPSTLSFNLQEKTGIEPCLWKVRVLLNTLYPFLHLFGCFLGNHLLKGSGL